MTEKILSKQNEIIISLLARQVLGEEQIKKIVILGKKNPNNYVRGYNACNGKNSVTEIANVIKVKQPTLTPILKSWEEKGIVYNIGEKNKPLYVKLLNLKEEKDARPEQGDTGRIEETQPESSEINIQE